jgi:hypothetical protein
VLVRGNLWVESRSSASRSVVFGLGVAGTCEPREAGPCQATELKVGGLVSGPEKSTPDGSVSVTT